MAIGYSSVYQRRDAQLICLDESALETVFPGSKMDIGTLISVGIIDRGYEASLFT